MSDYYVEFDSEGELVKFPSDGKRVRLTVSREARVVGEETLVSLTEGSIGTVISSVPEWHDTHVYIEGHDVWIDPCELEVIP